MQNIGYSDFIRICQIECPDTWCDWLSVQPDGVYLKVLSTDVWLMPEERAVLTEHPTGNLDAPVLPFPCSVREFMLFLDMQGIGIEIDEKYMSSEQYGEVAAYLGSIPTTTHRLGSRVHTLEHIINMAKKRVNEPNNYQSVWAEMVRIAELESPPAPIKEYVEGEGIKYFLYKQDEDVVRFFTKNALRKRMERQGC